MGNEERQYEDRLFWLVDRRRVLGELVAESERDAWESFLAGDGDYDDLARREEKDRQWLRRVEEEIAWLLWERGRLERHEAVVREVPMGRECHTEEYYEERGAEWWPKVYVRDWLEAQSHHEALDVLIWAKAQGKE